MLRGTDEIGPPTGVTVGDAGAYKQNLMRRIALEEEGVRKAESAHATNVELGKAYARLSLLYSDAAQLGRAEAGLEHAVSLLRHASEPDADLATAMGQLASVHLLMGKVRESEREDQEALRLRQELGDPLQIARSRGDLAILYLNKQKYEKARDLARQAEAEFVTNGRARAIDRITTRFTLSEALCYLKDCPSAIPLLKAALDEAKATMRPDDFPLGLSTFLLGYAYWKSGDMRSAAEYLERGSAQMNAQLGWGHPAYLKALGCYAQFLHENNQGEAASVVERRIRQAKAVVDVRSMQTAQGMFGIDGLR
ncbi:MAG TPA: tetratricopeptide repeat protein [Edaphobacter sp.]